eukprot:gene17489-19927_t
MSQNLAGIDISQNRNRARSAGRARAGTISDPDKKQVIKSLLDLFLEDTVQENAANESEDGSPQVNMKLLEDIEAFLHQVALCYQSYGCPTHTIETNMSKVATGLGITAQFLVFPSHIFVEIDNVKTEHNIMRRHNRFFRSSSGYNFYKLQLVDELVRRISSYAQEAEDVPEVQALDVEAVDQAFTRARAYSEALAGGGGGLPMPSAAVLAGNYNFGSSDSENRRSYDAEESGDIGSMGLELPVLFNGVEGKRRMTNSPRGSPRSGYMKSIREDSHDGDDEEGEEDMTQTLSGVQPESFLEQLSSWPRVPSLKRPSTRSDSTHEHDSKAQNLTKMILNLARLGPNIYESGGVKDTNAERTYRNLFSKLAVEDGVKLIKAIIKQKPQYSIGFKVLLIGTSSFGACGLFYGGSWTDCAFALCLGVLIGCIELISLVSPTFSRIYEFVATFVASIIIRAINAHAPSICFRAVLLGTIVFALQGVTITLAFVDLMTKDLTSGTTRLFFGMLVSAMIGFAIDISTSTYASLTERTYESVALDSHCDNPVSRGWYPLLFVIMTMSFNLLLEAHINQLLQMIFITACSYLVYYFLALNMDNQLPVILASFTASLLSNLYSRRTGQPAVVYIIPAIFLLVPGSVAASSFYTVLLLDLQGGLNLTFAVVTGALSVAIGIFAASALAPVPDVEEFFRKTHAASRTDAVRSDDSAQNTLRKRMANRNSGLTF